LARVETRPIAKYLAPLPHPVASGSRFGHTTSNVKAKAIQRHQPYIALIHGEMRSWSRPTPGCATRYLPNATSCVTVNNVNVITTDLVSPTTLGIGQPEDLMVRNWRCCQKAARGCETHIAVGSSAASYTRGSSPDGDL